MTIHSSILVWIFPWTRNLVGYSTWDCRIKQIEHRIMCSMQAYTHTHTDTHKRMHTPGLTFSRAQRGSSRLRAPGLCAYLEEAYLLVLKYEPEKQVSDLTSIWESAKLFRDGDWRAPSFIFFFFLVGAIFKLSLCLTTAYCISETSLYSNLSRIFATATTQGTPLDHLALKMSRTWTCVLIAVFSCSDMSDFFYE